MEVHFQMSLSPDVFFNVLVFIETYEDNFFCEDFSRNELCDVTIILRKSLFSCSIKRIGSKSWCIL